MLYGGDSCPAAAVCPEDGLWAYDSTGWRRICSGCPPGHRQEHVLVRDSVRDVIVIFGGRNSIDLSGTELWEWNGATWSSPTPAGTPPPPLTEAVAAFDEERGRMVLFGGVDATGTASSSLYEYDGASWYAPLPAAIGPGARASAVAAWDGDRVVVYGGIDDGGQSKDDAWAWDGSTWTELCANCTGTARAGAAFGYDRAAERLVLTNGWGPGEIAGTWTFDGNNWTVLSSVAPYGRDNSGMAWDPVRNRLVQFGGNGASCGHNPPVNCRDTLELTRIPVYSPTVARTWVERFPATNPGRRAVPKMVFVPFLDAVLLYGGANAGLRLDDTWLYDGDDWQLMCDPCAPGQRAGHGLIYDSQRQRVVLFSGATEASDSSNDIWEWDGVTWTEATPSGVPPSVRVGALVAYDPGRGVMVTYGGELPSGSGSDELFEYDGTEWRGPLTSVLDPADRYDAGSAATWNGSEVMILGGYTGGVPAADAWSWNGVRWQQLCVNCLGSPRRNAAIAYDSDRDLVVVATGYDGSDEMNDTWEWDGAWRQISAFAPVERDGGAMAYDPIRHRMLMYGGNGDDCSDGSNINCTDTLEYVPVP